MAPAPPWSDLPSELVACMANANGLSLRDHSCLRGVCTAWRSAVEPPYPCLLSLDDDEGQYNASVFSLPMRRLFHLHTVSSPIDDHDLPRLVSKFRDHDQDRRTLFSELRARARNVGSSKPSSTIDWGTPSEARARVVGSSNGRFAVAVDDSSSNGRTRKIFLLDPRASKEVELAAPTATPICGSGPGHGYVSKVLFPPGPDDRTVVAMYDLKFVAYIHVPSGRSKWTTIDVIGSNQGHLVDLAFGDDGKLYCVDSSGGVHVVCIPRGGRNDPANVEHLSSVFAPPYDIWSTLTTTKHVFFCRGSCLYQVWQNNSCIIRWGGFRMSEGEIFVLRYDPGRSPCWDVVKDLGGCSVFIDKKSNPAVVRAGGLPGVRANCVYWINWRSVPMVCDIATGVSKPCVLGYGACRGDCWYFGDDMTSSQGDDMSKGRN